MIRLPSCALVLLALLLLPHEAAAVHIDNLDAPVAKGSAITYRRLVSGVFKDAAKDDATGEMISASEKVLRRLGVRERVVVPAGTKLSMFSAVRVRSEGRSYIVMFWEAAQSDSDIVGGGAAIVAVFPEGSAEPQDVADVKEDMSCYLSDALIPLGEDDAFQVLNLHSNSNQAYLITTLFHLRGGRLRKIDAVFTLTVRSGRCETSFTETLAWTTEPDSGGRFPKVAAKVTLATGTPEDEPCESSRKFRRTTKLYTGTYRWDNAKDRFVPADTGLRELNRFNEKNL